MADIASKHRPKSLAESIATLEEQVFQAEQTGNTRQAKVIKLILKRFKSVDGKNAASLHKRNGKNNKAK